MGNIWTVIISILSSIATAISTFFLVYKHFLYKKEKRKELTDELNKIIEIAITYPYVESKNFTSKWEINKDSDDEKYLRYDMYCNRLYNHLHNVCEFFKYNKQKIEDFVDIKTWIRIHKQNWLSPVDENENIDGYDKKFRDFINSYLI
jgi:hypothetical protein